MRFCAVLGCALAVALVSCNDDRLRGLPAAPEEPPAPAVPPQQEEQPPSVPSCTIHDSYVSTEVYAPIDVVWVIDSSGSMAEENASVQNNLNAFSQAIASWGIDHHVVVVGSSAFITVPPPLGGSSSFQQVDTEVDSNEGLQKLLDTYADYAPMLRPDSVVHFVAVTDDESDLSSQAFLNKVFALGEPTFADGFVFHSIVAYGDWPVIGCTTGTRVGQQYLNLTDMSSGVKAPICNPDWSPVFTAIAESVRATAAMPCEFEIPDAPEGDEIDLAASIVEFTTAGAPALMTSYATGPEGCDALGWYYDDPIAPERVIACPGLCGALHQDPTARIDITFQCTAP